MSRRGRRSPSGQEGRPAGEERQPPESPLDSAEKRAEQIEDSLEGRSRSEAAKLDTLEARSKRSGRARPPPSRGAEAIFDRSVERIPALVVGALPAHVEVVPEARAGGAPTRADVEVVRVHPALVAQLQSPLVVGDRVRIVRLPNGQSWAAEAEPRATLLARAEVEKGRLPQPLVANARTLWVVVALGQPAMSPGLVDRLFVAAHAGGLVPKLCATKVDAPPEPWSVQWLELYERLGVQVVRTSVVGHVGLEALASALAGDFSVLVGQSGVGKSSLVRAILPGQPIAVGEMSEATGKGRHTTTVTRYYPLPTGGAVMDTPGLRELGLWSATRDDLNAAFPDVAALSQACRFDDCKHVSEPGCEVRRAAQAGDIVPERLASFRKLGDEIELRRRPGFGKPGGPSILK
jgi:ribosome biogenesis GTPase